MNKGRKETGYCMAKLSLKVRLIFLFRETEITDFNK